MVEHSSEPWTWQTFDEAPYGQDAYIVPSLEYKRAMECVNACAGINPEAVLEMFSALKEIALGSGPFARDRLQHAENTIEYMKELARAVLAKIKPAERKVIVDG